MKLFATLFLASAFLISCSKSDVVKPAAISAVDNSEALTAKNAEALLTANTWIYVKYYTNSDSVGSGTLAYKRGRANNTLLLDYNTVKFNIDGTVDEIDSYGNYVPGYWSFTNEEKTSMVVSNAYGSFYSNIYKLTATKFVWNNPYDRTTGIMQPKCE